MTDVASAVEGATVASAFRNTLATRPDTIALRWRDGSGWAEWTWQQYAAEACTLAAGLADLGVRRGDRVLLMLVNRHEFHAADIAIVLCGATPISVYNSSSVDQIAYIGRHAGARAAIVEQTFVDRMRTAASHLDELRGVVVLDGPAGNASETTYDELRTADAIDLEPAVGAIRPEDLATVIYTSGTTGVPKAVMLTHANVRYTAESFGRCLRTPWTDRHFVSFLPMAHIAERMTSHYDHLVFGSVVHPCPDPLSLGSYLRDVRPNVVFGAPRIWEKLESGLRVAISADTDRLERFDAALAVGRAVAEHHVAGSPVPDDLAGQWSKAEAGEIREALAMIGLDRCELAITGSAPVPGSVTWFFLSLGLCFSEIYGLSETCGPHTWAPYTPRPGSVGPAMPGMDLKLGADREVLLRGGNIFAGYLDDAEATAAAFDEQGWLRTGDLGEIDGDGFLRIVDRKKELLITSGGKNVSPAGLEAELKAGALIGQAMVVGDGKPYIAALIVLDLPGVDAWAARAGHRIDAAGPAGDPVIHAEIEAEVAAANARFSKAEQVKRFVILDREWLPDSKELTPTLKLRRREVSELYADEIAKLYT